MYRNLEHVIHTPDTIITKPEHALKDLTHTMQNCNYNSYLDSFLKRKKVFVGIIQDNRKQELHNIVIKAYTN